MNLYQIALEFRAALIRRERAAASEMVRAYGAVYVRLKAALEALLARIQAAQDAGEYSPSWLYQQRRLESLLDQVLAGIHGFAASAGDTITQQQRAAVYAAQDQAKALIAASQGNPPPGYTLTFTRLPAEALTDLVGFLQDGSPLRALLDQLGPQASEAVRKTLLAGLAAGKNPRVIAREMRADLGGCLTRALTISRTETLRAYRTAALRCYRANADVVTQWEWLCARSARTCAVCLAMDGKRFQTDVMMGTHPCCRCTLVPVTASWDALGYEGIQDRRPKRDTGAEWFAGQPEEAQRKILGDAKYEAWKAGKITLDDLVRFTDDPRWGPGRSEKSLADALRQ